MALSRRVQSTVFGAILEQHFALHRVRETA
jgi:hypothetical protein